MVSFRCFFKFHIKVQIRGIQRLQISDFEISGFLNVHISDPRKNFRQKRMAQP